VQPGGGLELVGELPVLEAQAAQLPGVPHGRVGQLRQRVRLGQAQRPHRGRQVIILVRD
jgi:hypothetical protein